MPEVVSTILFLFCLLQFKHMFADFFFQTPLMLIDRWQYRHLGRALHALIHALGSAVALAILGAPVGFILLICAAEWAVHFHIDWIKACYSRHRDHGPKDAAFWRALGFDQAMHQFTYVIMVWAFVRFATNVA